MARSRFLLSLIWVLSACGAGCFPNSGNAQQSTPAYQGGQSPRGEAYTPAGQPPGGNQVYTATDVKDGVLITGEPGTPPPTVAGKDLPVGDIKDPLNYMGPLPKDLPYGTILNGQTLHLQFGPFQVIVRGNGESGGRRIAVKKSPQRLPISKDFIVGSPIQIEVSGAPVPPSSVETYVVIGEADLPGNPLDYHLMAWDPGQPKGQELEDLGGTFGYVNDGKRRRDAPPTLRRRIDLIPGITFFLMDYKGWIEAESR